MRESTEVVSTSMFATSLETHLYGGPFMPPGYQSLFRTTTNPWTCPSPSSFGMSYKSSVMSILQLIYVEEAREIRLIRFFSP